MKRKTVLVVGGAGYVGAHMVQSLLSADYRVIVLDNLSTGHREAVSGGEFIRGSFGDPVLLADIFAGYRVDIVMHFGAYSLVGQSVTSPLDYYRNNLAATIELLQSMVRYRVFRFIFSSSAAVYGEPEQQPIAEDHPLKPTSAYGSSKLAVEMMLRDCERAYGMKYVSLRYFNAAGADASGRLGERHDPETHLIPAVLMVAAGLTERVKIFGTDYPTPDGTCIRDYVHVSDLAQAHLLALEALLGGGDSGVYNLGNSRGYSVREVISAARAVTGEAIPAIAAPRRPGDPALLVADSGRIRQQLQWRPQYEELTAIVESAWRWHRRQRQGNDPA